MNKPKVLFWDTETSYIVGATFSLRPEYIPHGNILEDWSVICGAYKWAGEKEVYYTAVKKYGSDKEVVKNLRNKLVEADLVVHHNGDKFDVRKLNARLIYHGLEPIPKLVTVDTLKHVKKIAQFTSNRLDYLGQHLLGEGKLHTREGLWLDVRNGSKEALQEMIAYNQQDVVVLEKIYDKLRPYMQGHPNLATISGGEKCDCPKCGEVKMQKRGFTFLASGNKRQRLQCTNPKCLSWHSVPLKDVK